MAILTGLIFIAVVMAAFFILGSMKWIASAKNEDNLYCESIRSDKMIKQPVNTWTNLSFILVGIIIMIIIDVNADSAKANLNLIASAGLYSILYGCCVIWLGPGSMFLHASQKVWGGWLDNISMNTYVSFLFVYDLTVLSGLGTWFFLLVYILLNIALALITWFWGEKHLGKYIFAGLITSYVVAEIIYNIKDGNREISWLIAGAVTFAIAFVIWFFSRTEQPLCKKDSLWQGHGAWHILASVTTLLLFFYLRSESM